MNAITRFAVFVFAAASLGACAMDTDMAIDSYQAIEQVVDRGEVVTTLVDFGDGNLDEAPGSLCACETDDCRESWVRDNYGCGLCIDATCADGSFAGACVFCDDQAASAPDPNTLPNQSVR